MKRILALILCLVLVFSLAACGGEKNKDTSSGTGSNKVTINAPQKPQYVTVGDNGSRTDDAVGFQLEPPEIGEKIVVFETSMGNIYIRLFPDSAPITVTNFVALVEGGYYNGITFHRVENNFIIQGGDPTATGTGGDSVWGKDFEDEFNANLLNIRGSLSMANAGVGTNGSQFFINQAKTSHDKSYYDFDKIYNDCYKENRDYLADVYDQAVSQYGESMTSQYPDAESYIGAYLTNYIGSKTIISTKVPDEVWDFYAENGGNIHLDGAWRTSGGHSVFGQVFAGLDIVDEIAAVSVNSKYKPVSDVVITKAYTTAATEEIIALSISEE